MGIRQKNTLLVTAIIAGLMSLPLTWITIRNPQLPFGGGMNGFGEMFGTRMSFDITGLNGHVTMLVKAPIWFVVCLAIGASVLQLMRHSQAFAVPTFAAWGTTLIGLAWTTAPLIPIVVTGKATPGIGWLLAMYCAAVPLACLVLQTRPVNEAANAVTMSDGEPIGD